MLLVTRSRSDCVPLWLVSDGDTMVGPVETDLLVRGVEQGKIPDGCWVREVRSEAWRRLDQVREIRARRLSADGDGKQRGFARAAFSLTGAADESEVFLFLLHGAVRATHASAGAIHRFRAPVALPVTSCVFGLPDETLGQVVPVSDPVLRLARAGECVSGSLENGPAERKVAERLGGAAFASVMMVPVLYGMELLALLELGRDDHAFRHSDREELQRLAALSANRIEELSW